jgi:hypothetical protein
MPGSAEADMLHNLIRFVTWRWFGMLGNGEISSICGWSSTSRNGEISAILPRGLGLARYSLQKNLIQIVYAWHARKRRNLIHIATWVCFCMPGIVSLHFTV